MKIILLLLLFNIINIFPQRQQAPQVEIFLGIIDNGGYRENSHIFYLNAVSYVWKGILINGQNYFYLSNEDYFTEYQPSHYNQPFNSWGGWDVGTSYDNNLEYPHIGFGLYKMFISKCFMTECIDKYFYLDYRDTRYGLYEYFGNPAGHAADIWIKYNNDENKFLYK